MFTNREIGRRRYQTRLKRLQGWPELTALVDILFLLLLFYVLSSSLVRVSGVSVELPRVKAANVAALQRFIISITAPAEPGGQCQVYFQDQPLSRTALAEQLFLLHDRSRRASVIIRADHRVPFRVVAEIMALAESARLSCFIAVLPPDEKPGTRFGQ